MGRLLKRVPLDFEWPMKQIWKGYHHPYKPLDCKACEGSGYSKEYKELEAKWYAHDVFNQFDRFSAWCYNIEQEDVQALVDADRLWDFTRVPLNDKQKANCHPNGWTKEPNGRIPTADEVNEWSRKGFGHDSCNCWTVIKARLKKDGIDHRCKHCKGEGYYWYSDEIKKLSENHTDYEPPVGDGFQLWENTSEGSPMTPVFKTLEELCEYCEKNCASFGTRPDLTKEQWFTMLSKGLVCKEVGNAIFL